MMKKVGITGNTGFVGRHLTNYLNLNEELTIIPFEKTFFDDSDQLRNFVEQCDVIVHLAAVNRHADLEELYNTNVALVENLIAACEAIQARPHIIFSSSTQESKDNPYGQSKRKGQEILCQWAKNKGGAVTNLIVPNIFGPFGKPNYNSFIATFCYRIIRQQAVEIKIDAEVPLIYVHQLVQQIESVILDHKMGRIEIQPYHRAKVTDVLNILNRFYQTYVKQGVFPYLSNRFELDLFNTFRSFLPEDFFPFFYTKHQDSRGAFVEIVRAEMQGQFSFSTTNPGITRGNHFHTRKIERFAVIDGIAKIQLRKIDENRIVEYILKGEEPAFVDMPIWYTHNITNIGNQTLTTLFWINEFYDPEDSDTYYVPV